MGRMLLTLALAVFFVAPTCDAQSEPERSLCSLQEQVAQGEHIHVRVAGIYSSGPENSTLEDSACPVTPYQSTWVEFELQTKRNDKRLKQLLGRSQLVYLAAEGDFYGPPLSNAKLPETLQKRFPPHWGHLGCCRTRFVVHKILEVKIGPVAK